MVEFVIRDNKLHCLFSGQMDTVAAMQLENGVDIKILHTKKPVVFDLQDVHYVCSGFIRICMKAQKAVGKDNFSIIRTDAFVTKAMTVAGMGQFLQAV